MQGINCFEAKARGHVFDVTPGIKIDRVKGNKLFINGLGTVRGVKPVPIQGEIETAFTSETGVWVGKGEDAVHIFRAGITQENHFVVPAPDAGTESDNSKYVRLLCSVDDDIYIIKESRILARLFQGAEQTVFLEMRREGMLIIDGGEGAVSILETSQLSFPVSERDSEKESCSPMRA